MLLKRISIVALIVAFLQTSTIAQQLRAGAVDAERWRALVEKLEPAAFVSVRLHDGSKLKGTVVAADQDSFALAPHTRIPVPARELRYDEIASLERAKPGMNSGLKVVVGVGAAVATFLILMVAALAGSD
jgi:hypothetical protein